MSMNAINGTRESWPDLFLYGFTRMLNRSIVYEYKAWILGFFVIVDISVFAQDHEVALQIQVMYDGETARPAESAKIYFGDGQTISENNKGIATRKFVLKDSTLLVEINKVMIDDIKAGIVNNRHLQYILLDESQKKKLVQVYILDNDAWNLRKGKVAQVVEDQYGKFVAEYDSMPKTVRRMVQDEVAGLSSYKPLLEANLSSTVYAELTDTGRKAYDLVLESNENLNQAIGLLAPSEETDIKVAEDFLLFARLSLLAFDRMASYYYEYLLTSAPVTLDVLMEYKEMAIMLDAGRNLGPNLERVLKYVNDPEFQASNRNDLASIYHDQGKDDLALSEALVALGYYRQLEVTDPSRFSWHTTSVMFNLANIYRKLDRNRDALPLLQESIQRVEAMPEAPPELQTMEFFGNKFIANIIQEEKGLREAYAYYDKMFAMLKTSPEVSYTLPKEDLFADYMDYCEAKELWGAPDDEISRCYEESLRLLDDAVDMERKTLGHTQVYLQLAKLLEEKGEYEKALVFYKRSLAELEQNESAGTREIRIDLYNCIGGLLVDYGQDEEAMDYFKKSLTLAEISGREGTAESLLHLGETWYRFGQYHYKQQRGDSAVLAFTKVIVFLTDPRGDREQNASLLANTYNMLGATHSELLIVPVVAEENFSKSVELYDELVAKDPETYMIEYASSASNLLALQARHVETTDKDKALALIDSVMKLFVLRPVHSPKAEELMVSMNRFMLLFSGQLNLIQGYLMEVQEFRAQRQQIKGQTGKSDIQTKILSKLEEAYWLVDSEMRGKLGTILAQELGNLSWYAIFDHKYSLAETSARKALALDPSQIWVNTNLAHSLILEGKVDEGKAIYQEYKDMKHSDGRLMRVVFLSDIEELQEAGIKNPAWEEVKILLQ